MNLLPDHLVDVLLDAAAMGVVRVQRDSLSAEQSACFALIGSMNPEEGQLRPQFLDRFGLCVDVAAPTDPAQRAEIIRRRMAFEADAAAFTAKWKEQEQELKARLGAARQHFGVVNVPDTLLDVITRMTTSAGVRSLRADLVLHRASRAFTALEGRTVVTSEDVEAVAPLVLNHRREPGQGPPPSPPPPQRSEEPQPQPPQGVPHEEIFAPTQALPLPLATPARAGRTTGGEREGRLIRTVPDPHAARLHLPSTLMQAAGRSGEPTLTREDFRAPLHEQVGGRRVLFVADASGSVGVSGRMGAVKAAMLDVLADQNSRDRVALVTFRGTGATLDLDWTNDAQAAEEVIRQAATGGRTPLAHALRQAVEVLGTSRGAELVIFTDGRANVPLYAGSDAWADALAQAGALRGVRCTVVDTEAGQVRLGRAAKLAEVLGAQLLELEQG